jgi:hypothetical protein
MSPPTGVKKNGPDRRDFVLYAVTTAGQFNAKSD